MSSHSHAAGGASSDAIQLPPPPVPVFEMNQARRGKVVRELETLRSAFLDWPTVEGLEAFTEKKVEYGEMMEDHVADLAAELAEEHRLQEFQRDLERMDPAEAEVVQKAERERALLVQREYEARLAELNAKGARERARVRAKYQ
ncbi:hypothetical protein BGY98DRAFT_747597 [Russula aff. rugulosa BPL654]|nr:hypothetical protein BGY98DRAFT_747597 [Russula aff. rugulosa BPL654]